MSTYKKRAIPEATRRAVAVRYGCEPGADKQEVPCHWCGALGSIHWRRLRSGKPSAWVSFPSLELDHVHPEALGGTSDPENIVLACRSCNRRRGSRVPHVSLTEEVLPNSPAPHDRKGREGKGIGVGTEISSLTFANADTREASHVSDHPPTRRPHRVTGQASTRWLG